MTTNANEVFMVVGANEGSPLELLAMPEEEQRFNVLMRTDGEPVVKLERVTWEDALGWIDAQRLPH